MTHLTDSVAPVILAATPASPLRRRLSTLAVGLVLVGAGVALMIRGQLGVAPYDVLTTGVAAAAGISIAVAAMVVPLAFVAFAWSLGRRPGPGTLIAVLTIGPIIGLVLRFLPHVEAMAVRLPLFAVGFLIVCAGVTGVVIAEIGPGPAEIVMLALHDKGFPLAPARTGIELCCVAVGWAVGGQVGVGTALVTVLIGPILRWMLVVCGFPAHHRPTDEPATAEDVSIIASPGV